MSGGGIRKCLWYSLGHCNGTTVAVQMTLALTGTHSNPLLTISLLTNRYIFTVHLYTVHIKKLCCICWKRKTFCCCYCLRLTEFSKKKDWCELDHYELKIKCRSSTIHNMKKYIFSYNNISTIRALLIAVRCKKGFHEIICHSDVLLVTVDTTASPALCIVFLLLV